MEQVLEHIEQESPNVGDSSTGCWWAMYDPNDSIGEVRKAFFEKYGRTPPRLIQCPGVCILAGPKPIREVA